MAVTAKLYSNFPLNLGGGDAAGEQAMDLLSDTLKNMLTTSTHTISQTADALKADLDNEVAAGGGYTAGGETLAGKAYSTTALVTTFDASDTVWSTATFTAAHAHLYDDTLAVAGQEDPLISYVDFGGDETVTTADFTIQWNASGIFTLTVA